MNPTRRDNPRMPAAALLGLAVALPVAIAAESGAALMPLSPRGGEVSLVQRADSSSWVDRVCELARNLCQPQVAIVDAPIAWVPSCEPTGAAIAASASCPSPIRLCGHELIDLPPPSRLF